MTTNPYALNRVRSLKNYGLYIAGACTADPIFSKGWMNAKPNVLVNGSTCYIDYSHVFDVSNRVYLKRTFGSFASNSGQTFYFSPTEYYDEITESRYTVGGTCNFSQSLNDSRLIVATIASGFTSNTSYNYYAKENFVDFPQYTFTSSGQTGYYYLINSLPDLSKTNFVNSGSLGTGFGTQDYVEISGSTGNNFGRLLIYGSSTLKDGQEIMYLASGGQDQNFSNTATTVNFYLRGEPSLATFSNSEIITGIFIVNDSSGNLIECYENQNGNQFVFRNEALNKNYRGNYILCKNCPEYVYGEDVALPIGAILSAFGNVLFLYLQASVVNGTTYYKLYSQSVSIGANTTLITSNNTSLTEFLFSNTPSNLKIDLSHPSLIGYTLNVYTDEYRSIPASYAVDNFGPPGYNTAYAYVNTTRIGAGTLYCTLSGPQNINFTLTFS